MLVDKKVRWLLCCRNRLVEGVSAAAEGLMVGGGERLVAADAVEPVGGVGSNVVDVPAFGGGMAAEKVPVAFGGDVGGDGDGGMMVELVIDDSDVVYID